MLSIARYVQIPIEELTKPKDGYTVMLDRYWVVLNGKALFYKSSQQYTSPQCNDNKALAAYLKDKCYPEGTEIQFIPIAYVKDNMEKSI